MATAREVAEELRKKKTQTGNEDSSVSARQEAEKIKKYRSLPVDDVNEEYINSFISDYNSFFSGVNENSLDYDTAKSTLGDLSTRYDTIQGWLYKNRSNLDEETYNTLSSSFEGLKSSFDSVKDYYSQWVSDEEYNKALMGWLDTEAETNEETVASRQAQYQSNEARVAEIKDSLPWYGDTILPTFIENWFLSDEQEALKEEMDTRRAENRKYSRTQGVTDSYYTPVTEEFTQNAAYRDYTNATKDELWNYDVAQMNASTALGNGGYYDEDGNVRDAKGNIVMSTKAPEVQDKLGMFLNASDEDISTAYNELSAAGGNYTNTWANMMQEGDVNGWKHLSDHEVEIYYDLYKREGQEAAYQYLDAMTTELTRRATQEITDYINNASVLEQIGLNIASVPMNVFGGLASFVDDAANILQGEDINPYSRAHTWQNAASNVREKTATDITELTGNAALPVIGTTFGDVYQALMSAADSATGVLMGGKAYGVLMGMGAASSEMKDLYEQGASLEQIATGGILAGAAEMVFEKFSIDKLVSMGDSESIKDIVANLLKQGGIEASEEMATEIANTITNAVVMGNQSDWQDVGTFVKNVVNAGIGGFISGGVMGGAGSAASYANYNQQTKAYGQSIIDQGGVGTVQQLATDMAGDTSTPNAKAIAKQSEKTATKTTAKNVGKLADRMGDAVTTQNQTEIAAALEEKGLSKKEAKRVAAYLQKATQGGEFTAEEAAEIEGNESIADVYVELIGNTASATNTRSQKLSAAINGEDYARLLEAAQQPQEATEVTGDQTTTAAQNAAQTATGAAAGASELSDTHGVDIEDEQESSISGDGVTRQVSTNKAVTPQKIVSIEGGKAMIQTDSGTIAEDDITFGDADTDLLWRSAASFTGITPSSANGIIRAYNGDGSVTTYLKGAAQEFRNGYYNIESGGEYADQLTPAQRAIIYDLGQQSAGENTAKAQAAAKKATAEKSSATVSKTERGGKVHYEGDRTSLTKRQSTSLTALERVADALGVQIYVFESQVDENGKHIGKNGWYDPGDGSIHIDLYAGVSGEDTMLFTAAHELVHFIKEWSPAKFKVLANFLMQEYGKAGVSVEALVRKQIAKAKRDGRSISYDTAYEEVIADSMEVMLADGQVVEKLAKLKAKDQTLWQKMKEFIDSLAAKIRNAYQGLKPDSAEGRYVAKMTDAIGRLQELFAEALVDAGGNYQAAQAQKNTTQEGGEEKYSQRYLAADTNSEILSMVSRVANGNFKANEKVYLGVVSDAVADQIYDLTGIHVNGFKIAVEARQIEHILKDHGANGAADHSMADHSNIAKMEYALSSPDDIRKAGKSQAYTYMRDGKNRTADTILYEKNIGTKSYYVVQAVPDAKAKTLYVVTAFIGKSGHKKEAPQLINAKSLDATAKTGSASASINSISDKTEKVNTKFSMRAPVEYTKDLVALHNLTEEKLTKTLAMGGFPMPSIAVTKADIPHTNFGEITLIFGKETIDPKANKKNVVYSADAWTPTFPPVEYEVDSHVDSRVNSKLRELEAAIDDTFQDDLNRLKYSSEDNLNRYGGEEGLIQHAMENYGLKAAYLEEQGQHIDKVTKQVEADKGFNSANEAKYQAIADILGVTSAEEIGSLILKEAKENYGEMLEDIYPGMTKTAIRMGGIFRQVGEYLSSQDSAPVYKTVTDVSATRQAVDDALDMDGFEAWTRELFSGIEKDSGIYNQKDIFTPSGNRRSFKQTHLPVTLENIVKAMAAQNNGNTKNVSGFNGIKTLRAGTAERFKSIEAMHQSDGRLQHLTQEEAGKINDDLSTRLFAIIEAIDAENGQKGDSNSFMRFDTIGEILTEISEGNSYNVADIQSVFSGYGRSVSDGTAADIKQLLYDVTQMPVNIFEAKPERVVGFGEVKAAILPDGTSQNIVDGLQKKGVPIHFYQSGNDTERLQLVNSIDGVKFSDRDAELERVNSVLTKENAELRYDINYLKELLKLQKQVTGGTKFTKTSVEAAASKLMKYAGAKGSKAELAWLLNGVYEYIAKGEELSWEGVSEKAQPAVQWLQENVRTKQVTSSYAKDILRQIRVSRVYLDELQKKEVAYQYGSYNDFRKQAMGSVIITDTDAVSLDTQWQEWASQYPNIFDPETTTNDMPAALMDAVDTLRNMTESDAYGYDDELTAQDLLSQVYDSYWDVSTLYTAADAKQKEINRLKYEHIKRMSNLREYHREQTARLKQEHREALQRVRQEQREKAEAKQKAITERYQESRQKSIESRRKTEMRRKIRRTIMELNKLLNRGDKKRNVKEDMKDLVAQALDSADILFTDEYSHEDMIRNGVGTELAEQEAKYMDEARALLEQIDSRETPQERQEAAAQLHGKLSYRMSKLQDVFTRERARLNKTKVSEVLGSLADAYASLENSEQGYVKGAFDENVHQYLLTLRTDVGGTIVKDMSLNQLENLRKAYTMVLTTVRNANRMFAADMKQSREELASRTMAEVKEAGGEHGLWLPGEDKVSSFLWNNQKPVYAFEHIGSSTLTKLFENTRAGEDSWAQDMTEAREFYLEKTREYDYDSWDFEKRYAFTSNSGIKFELNLEQIMSLYAYSKREQAHEHLLKGGFVFDGNTEVQVNKHGIKVTYLNKTAKAHNLSPEILGDIISKLTDEQRAFADEMQDYLSTTMGDKGNEVSMQMYGVKLFNEKHYFPLRSAGQYMERAKEADLKKEQGQISIVNSGFTKSTTPKASNPVVLSGFMDVWADHVNEMSMYHSFVLPMEDFRRVYNYSSPNTETGQSVSVNQVIQDAYGEAATKYIDQLYRDLNGGAVSDPRETTAKALMGKFKKAAVFASLSVTIQQPSAIGRAFAIIDPKYFIGGKVDSKRHKALWAELKQYAPVATIKEMGYFDTGMGKSAQDFLKGKEYKGLKEKAAAIFTDGDYRDELLSKAPALADELTWCAIWDAAKRETKAKKPGLDVKSAEFLQIAGKRFTEVITKTQVYDSVLSRSANMRSKGAFMSMWTAFMAEPTTTINMMEDALRKAKRGNKKYAARATGAVLSSIVLNSLLVSLVYAMRDDDEDETFLEKYAQSFAVEILDGINPLTYYPFLKDIWSAAQGFDIERSDMSLITSAIEASTKVIQLYAKKRNDMDEEEQVAYNKSLADAWWGVVDYVTALAGIPVKNVRRDINGAMNVVETISADTTDRDTTWGSLLDKVLDDVKNTIPVIGWLPDETAADKLYKATVSGDTVYQKRLASSYTTENSLNNAIRKGLRANDSRIWEAAIAWNNDDLETYMRVAKAIIGEGNFSQDNVVAAIQAEASAMAPKESESTASKAKGYFTAEKFAVAISQGSSTMAATIKADIIETAQINGKTADEAEDSFISSAKTQLKKLFEEDGVSASQAFNALVSYCEVSDEDAQVDVQYWTFQKDYPDYDLSESAVTKYYEYAESAGIGVDVYYDYHNQASQCESDKDEDGNTISGSKKAKIMAVIDSLDITGTQKDALYYANGWAESTIDEAPWH